MIKETKKELLDRVKDFHSTNYPGMKVNYPKKFKVDLEKQKEPFVVVEITTRQESLGMPKRNCVIVSGELILNLYARENSGTTLFDEYSDKLFTYFGLKTINRITYMEVSNYDNATLAGFDGTMCVIPFEIEFFNV